MNQEHQLCFCIWHSCSHISVVVELSSENYICSGWTVFSALIMPFSFTSPCVSWAHAEMALGHTGATGFELFIFFLLILQYKSCMELQLLWPNIKMLQESGKLYQQCNYRNFLYLIKINTCCLWVLNRVTVFKVWEMYLLRNNTWKCLLT